MPGLDKCALILVAGGAGNRFSARQNKLLSELDGQNSVFAHSLLTFAPLFTRERFVVVIPPALENDFQKSAQAVGLLDAVIWVAGGDTRDISAAAGLAALPPGIKYVAIHDAARPLATPAILYQCLAALDNADGAIPVKKLTDTIKVADENNFVQKTLDRSTLYAAETPQLFRLSSLLAARKKFAGKHDFTDDASILEAAGMTIAIISNPQKNPKLTYPDDLEYLRWLLNSKNSGRDT